MKYLSKLNKLEYFTISLYKFKFDCQSISGTLKYIGKEVHETTD